MAEMSELKQYIIDPKEFTEYNDDDFDISGNEIILISLVKKNNHIYVKKEFDFNENEEEEDTPEIDEYNDDCSSDFKNPKKYFQREVRHLYDVQIEGYPFLRFIGFNYRTVDSSPFIITEYMKGKTLSKLIENQFNEIESPSTTKMIIFYGVAFALKILHSMKIIHRDIKPENIFLNEEKEPFLGDFGFARYIQESTKLTEKTGTTYYKPVELFDNENPPKPSDKIDSYSFAVTVLETLTYDLKIFDKKKEQIFE